MTKVSLSEVYGAAGLTSALTAWIVHSEPKVWVFYVISGALMAFGCLVFQWGRWVERRSSVKAGSEHTQS